MLWIVLGIAAVWLLALLFVVSLGAAAARGDRLRRMRRPDGMPVIRLARRRGASPGSEPAAAAPPHYDG